MNFVFKDLSCNLAGTSLVLKIFSSRTVNLTERYFYFLITLTNKL